MDTFSLTTFLTSTSTHLVQDRGRSPRGPRSGGSLTRLCATIAHQLSRRRTDQPVTGVIRACIPGRRCTHSRGEDAQPGHLEPRLFSLYDMCMASEEQIQKWADEAEAGYDVEELKRRGRGRPGRGAEPMRIVAVRLTAEELDALDASAAKSGMSRSEAIRAALAHFAA